MSMVIVDYPWPQILKGIGIMYQRSREQILIPFSFFHTLVHLCCNNKILHTELEKAMAPHSSTLAWKIPWTEEPGRLQSMGSLRVRHN